MEAKDPAGVFTLGVLILRSNAPTILAGIIIAYLAALSVYRLYLTPSAKFPGPKLAALTFWYEFYYDVWVGGQYTWKIRDLHREYGPFVRINPYEVHCDDLGFFDTLYVNSSKRRTDKWEWAIRQSWTRDSAFKTLSHELHKQRRNQLNPFFSKSSVRTLEPFITGQVNELCARLEESSAASEAVNLTHAFVALTVDIISRVCYGSSYKYLAQPDFAREWYEGMVVFSRAMPLIRQFPWISELLRWFPLLAPRATTVAMAAEQERHRDLANQVEAVIDRYERGEKPPTDAFTVFHSMLDADVPAAEKSLGRLTSEAHTITGAGAMTTAKTLETTFYHLFDNSAHLDRLKQELDAAIPDPAVIPPAAELEKLPFLAAVVNEGLRLSKGVTHRFARVSPDVPYRYDSVVIPRGVPVGMSFMDIMEDPDIYPDPDTFMPERWLPMDAPEARNRRKALLAIFGGGSRMCLGMNLAWAELYLTIAAVVRRFGGRLEMRDVVFERDVKITVDGFNALSSPESEGLRVTICSGPEQ